MRDDRARVVDFFAALGLPRVAIARETLSRFLRIAYPTLDPILEGLERDGFLEKHPICADQWWPTYAAAETIADEAKAAKARRLAEAIAEREADRAAREEAIRRRAEERAAAAEARERARIERAKRAAEERVRRFDAAKIKPVPERAPRPKVEGPLVKPTGEPPATPAYDPWAIIRARHYGRPPLISSSFKLEPEELMTGRARKRA